MRNQVKAIATAIALTAAMLGTAAARHVRTRLHPAYASPCYEVPAPRKPCFSLDDCDRKAFDESGTRGRMGLGADPAHPEGPGNFSN